MNFIVRQHQKVLNLKAVNKNNTKVLAFKVFYKKRKIRCEPKQKKLAFKKRNSIILFLFRMQQNYKYKIIYFRIIQIKIFLPVLINEFMYFRIIPI